MWQLLCCLEYGLSQEICICPKLNTNMSGASSNIVDIILSYINKVSFLVLYNKTLYFAILLISFSYKFEGLTIKIIFKGIFLLFTQGFLHVCSVKIHIINIVKRTRIMYSDHGVETNLFLEGKALCIQRGIPQSRKHLF